ncbi:tRNA glutamyl-Q(34) synthetase GluQRS [Roseobacter sp. YSTF-M11]|uniref:tRNA glutamyl-Q(34) synthetase GluQRS n=1 Tax=Roseobacter insulae TaxID=2859783 RepID=A0A9X1FW30_9RHOB|nr:tRNA glutamyl-Q(34) synthetase GluQRS [Roseobacter insulae]MBW4708786.1 tRNA glutamyl-Q(34) synthetase GluQRS [Roseobacter insulae]
MIFTTRFAPSPTGPLHLGHAYSAMIAHDMAMARGGEFLLRIEDIDQSRARPAWEAQIYDDLAWLGLTWPTPVMRQSDRLPEYAAALDVLWLKGYLYPCDCSRRDITEALSAPQEGAPLSGPDGLVYPGTCREKDRFRYSADRERPVGRTLRLASRDAFTACHALSAPKTLQFDETGRGPDGQTGQIPVVQDEFVECVGDFVVSRRDMGTSYHLSVVLDDAAQGITDVVRGEDLFEATEIHVVLQDLLGLPTPRYHHHRLIRNERGKRLAKRDDARALTTFRNEGATPDDIRRLVGLSVPA